MPAPTAEAPGKEEMKEAFYAAAKEASDLVVELRRRREALVHAAMPWIPTDRQRRMLLLRFKPQHPGSACFPPEIMQRLAPETRAVAELWGEGEVRAVATQPGSARL